MARSLHFNASWLYQESAGIGTSTGTGSPAASVAPFKPASPAPQPVPSASAPTPAPVASDVAALAERAVVTELTFLGRRDIGPGLVASSIVHEGVHARVHAMAERFGWPGG